MNRRHILAGAVGLAATHLLTPFVGAEPSWGAPRLWFSLDVAPGTFDEGFAYIREHVLPLSVMAGVAEIRKLDMLVRKWEWEDGAFEDGTWVEYPDWTAYSILVYSHHEMTWDWQNAMPVNRDRFDISWSDSPLVIQRVLEGPYHGQV